MKALAASVREVVPMINDPRATVANKLALMETSGGKRTLIAELLHPHSTPTP